MKNINAVVSSVLVLTMAFSLSGCRVSEAKFSPSGLSKYAKSQGAECYDDPDEWCHDLENVNGDITFIEDGVYFYAKKDVVKDTLKGWEVTEGFYSVTINEATIYIVGDYSEKDDTSSVGYAISLSYNNEVSAVQFYKQHTVALEVDAKSNPDAECDDFKDGSLQYFLYSEDVGYSHHVCGIYLQGNTVLLIFGVGDDENIANKHVYDICEALDLASPGDL